MLRRVLIVVALAWTATAVHAAPINPAP